MNVEVRETESGVWVVVPEGNIDVITSVDLKRRVYGITHTPQCKLVFNLEKVDYLDSAGLEAFIHILKNVKQQKGKISFCGVDTGVHRTLEVLGLNKIFQIYPQEDSAILYLKE